MSNDSDGDTGTVVPFVRGDAQVRHDDETKVRCFVLYGTMAGRNCAAVERLIAEEYDGTGLPVPTRAAIARWAADERWAEQADDMWRSTKARTLFELQVMAASNAMLAQKRKQDVLLGRYDGREMTGALHLKAAELSDRFIERVLPLASIHAPEPERDTSGMSRDEKEALARKAMKPGRPLRGA